MSRVPNAGSSSLKPNKLSLHNKLCIDRGIAAQGGRLSLVPAREAIIDEAASGNWNTT